MGVAMAAIKVVVNGATGKMGMETVAAVAAEDGLELAGAVCHLERGAVLAVPGGADVPLSTDLPDMLDRAQPDVLVDFTNSAACMEAIGLRRRRSPDGGIVQSKPEPSRRQRGL